MIPCYSENHFTFCRKICWNKQPPIFFLFKNHLLCVKNVRIRSYSGPYFPRIFQHSDWIRSECGKMPKNADQSNSEHGHLITQCLNICILNWIMKLYHYNSIELWDFNWLSKHIEKIIPNHVFILTNFCNVILCSTLRLWKIKYKKRLRIVASWGFKNETNKENDLMEIFNYFISLFSII